MAVAQKFLRHSDVRIAIHTCGHLDVEDVREGISRSFMATNLKVGTAPGLQDALPEPGDAPSNRYGAAANEG